jgi:hypothetical protein
VLSVESFGPYTSCVVILSLRRIRYSEAAIEKRILRRSSSG